MSDQPKKGHRPATTRRSPCTGARGIHIRVSAEEYAALLIVAADAGHRTIAALVRERLGLS